MTLICPPRKRVFNNTGLIIQTTEIQNQPYNLFELLLMLIVLNIHKETNHFCVWAHRCPLLVVLSWLTVIPSKKVIKQMPLLQNLSFSWPPSCWSTWPSIQLFTMDLHLSSPELVIVITAEQQKAVLALRLSLDLGFWTFWQLPPQTDLLEWCAPHPLDPVQCLISQILTFIHRYLDTSLIFPKVSTTAAFHNAVDCFSLGVRYAYYNFSEMEKMPLAFSKNLEGDTRSSSCGRAA